MRTVAALWTMALLCAGCDGATARAERVDLSVRSSAFDPGGDIPREHACDGVDRSPPLVWEGAPSNTRSYVLTVTDPDAPRGTFTHWVVWDLPPQGTTLDAGQPEGPRLPGGGRQGRNGFGTVAYRGPCPPHGSTHRYFFRVHALDSMLGLESGVRREDVEAAMADHVLGMGEVMGRYARAQTTDEQVPEGPAPAGDHGLR